ncbi:MAG: type II toxin-antitoxin system VapC family toxin [Pirellulales bacterium]
MKYLVDADVLSEPTKPRPAQRVVDWLRKFDRDLAVSPIILGELEYGILLLPASRKRTRLLDWFAAGVKQLNVLEFDATTASAWAKLLAELQRKGKAMPIKDSLIAATAKQHQLTLATRNTADYRHAGVPLVNPFKER